MKPRVLIVVQDARFKDALAEKLQQRKFSVWRCDTAQGVSEILGAADMDVVLLDVRRERGEEAMQILADVKRSRPATEVILLSSGENIALSMEGMRRGAFDDITVPFDLETLADKIRQAWTRKRARSRPARRRTLFSIFEDAMVATTFAEVGEFESAKEVCAPESDPSPESEVKAKDRRKRKHRPG